MMKKIFYFAFCLSFFLFHSCQNEDSRIQPYQSKAKSPLSNWKKDNLRARVKRFVQERSQHREYFYDRDGFYTKQITYSLPDTPSSPSDSLALRSESEETILYTYNQDHFITKIEFKNYRQTTTSMEEYTYDEYNRKTGMVSYISEEGMLKRHTQAEYSYREKEGKGMYKDQDGKKIAEETVVLDESNHVLETIKISNDPDRPAKLTEKIVYRYDANGQPIEEKSYHYHGSSPHKDGHISRSYNANFQETKVIDHLDKVGNVEIKYDETTLLPAEAVFIGESIKFSYTLDSHGNYIYEATEKVRRSYEYYE